MKSFKKAFSLLIIMLLCLSLMPSAFAVVGPSESFYVADYANVLSNSTEEMIINYNGALEQQCQGAQIVVVTVDYLEGMYSDQYAYQLFNDWGVGSGEYNNGMLLLLAVEENKGWLAYGMGLSSQLDGDSVDEMLEDYFWRDFDRGNYDEAVNSLFPELLSFYDGVYGSAVSGIQSSSGGDRNQAGHGGPDLFSILSTLLMIFVVISFFGGFRRGRRGGGSWLPWFLFFNSRNSRHYHSNDHDDFGGFGGFGGGGFGSGGGFGGFGGGSGSGGGGFSGGGGGRR